MAGISFISNLYRLVLSRKILRQQAKNQLCMSYGAHLSSHQGRQHPSCPGFNTTLELWMAGKLDEIQCDACLKIPNIRTMPQPVSMVCRHGNKISNRSSSSLSSSSDAVLSSGGKGYGLFSLSSSPVEQNQIVLHADPAAAEGSPDCSSCEAMQIVLHANPAAAEENQVVPFENPADDEEHKRKNQSNVSCAAFIDANGGVDVFTIVACKDYPEHDAPIFCHPCDKLIEGYKLWNCKYVKRHAESEKHRRNVARNTALVSAGGGDDSAKAAQVLPIDRS